MTLNLTLMSIIAQILPSVLWIGLNLGGLPSGAESYGSLFAQMSELGWLEELACPPEHCMGPSRWLGFHTAWQPLQRWSYTVARVSECECTREQAGNHITFSDSAWEVTQRHFHHTLLFKAAIRPSRLKERGGHRPHSLKVWKQDYILEKDTRWEIFCGSYLWKIEFATDSYSKPDSSLQLILISGSVQDWKIFWGSRGYIF